MASIATFALALLGVAYAQYPHGRRRGGPSPTPGPAPGPAPPQPPLKGNIVYHLFEPKYTGLANKDAGDFKGDMSFIFSTFTARRAGNPEASMEENILEMTQVNVTGWGQYEACNAPGCTGNHVCPANQTVYCCEQSGHHGGGAPAKHDKTSLPGLEVAKHATAETVGGWWFSFPMESEGFTWKQKLLRRINGKCLGDAWRKDAGGCPSCGESLDECVADCIQTTLNNTAVLEKTWDRVFADPTECPEVPLPGASSIIV